MANHFNRANIMRAQIVPASGRSRSTHNQKIVAPTVWGLTPGLLARFFWIIIAIGVIDGTLLFIYMWVHMQSGANTLFTTTDDFFNLGAEILNIPICLFAWKKLRMLRSQQVNGVSQRILLAVICIGLAALFAALGQSLWIAYDAFSVIPPHPSMADIAFNLKNILFLPGVLLLIPSRGSIIGRTRMLLDAGTIVFSFIALFWFFWLSPTLTGLSGNWLTKSVLLLLPSFDLLNTLIVIFLLFNPFGSSNLKSTLTKLCIGAGTLALTDLIYGYIQVSGRSYSGMLVEIGWPIAWLFIGWAILTYPDEIVEKTASTSSQQKAIRAHQTSSIFAATMRVMTPLLFTVLTCCLLLIAAMLKSTFSLSQIVLVCGALFLLPIIRQCITLIDNTLLNERLQLALTQSEQAFMQSQDELLETVTRVDHLENLRSNIEHLQAVHARLARGDMNARAIVAGPLAPVAQSLNLSIDRMSRWRQSEHENQLLISESEQLNSVLNTLSEGQIANPIPKVRNSSPIGIALMTTVRLQHRLELSFRREQELVTLIGKRLYALQKTIQHIQQDQNHPAPLANSLLQVERGLAQQQNLLQEMWIQSDVYQIPADVVAMPKQTEHDPESEMQKK